MHNIIVRPSVAHKQRNSSIVEGVCKQQWDLFPLLIPVPVCCIVLLNVYNEMFLLLKGYVNSSQSIQHTCEVAHRGILLSSLAHQFEEKLRFLYCVIILKHID